MSSLHRTGSRSSHSAAPAGATESTVMSPGRLDDAEFAAVPGLTGPVGEPALPPSRPSSVATAFTTKSERKAQLPSRRGPAFPIGGASRPPSSGNRTHVPSLAATAFFRPMSSQRLQAQRAQRPGSALGQSSTQQQQQQERPEAVRVVKRRSADSVGTGRGVKRQAASSIVESEGYAPPSRGTEMTEDEYGDRFASSGGGGGGAAAAARTGTAKSQVDSTAPLHQQQHQQPRPVEPRPRSFRSSFVLPSLSPNAGTIRPQQRLEKLPSGNSTPRLPSAPAPAPGTDKHTAGRNYHYFTGNTVFCWGGRLQNTRARPLVVLTGILVLVPSALFAAFSAPWLWRHASPVVPLLFAYVALIALSSLFHAAFTNPGILPRNLHAAAPADAAADPLKVGPPTHEWVTVLSRTCDSGAMEVPTKYCRTCELWRPVRAHHCRVCDNCVETQDHHCVWLNNCVGRRNYRYFFAFVGAGTLLGLLLFAASLAHVLLWRQRQHASLAHAVARCRVPFAMAVYGAVATPYPASLLAYHLFLMSRGHTTREFLHAQKLPKRDRHRPFTQGNAVRNWCAVLLRPRPPAYLHFKAEYVPGDPRFGPRRGHRTAPLPHEQQAAATATGWEMKPVSEPGPGQTKPSKGTAIDRTPRPDVPLAPQPRGGP